jgi:hypothetical protein
MKTTSGKVSRPAISPPIDTPMTVAHELIFTHQTDQLSAVVYETRLIDL